MTDHFSPTILNALADDELPADQLSAANQHLARCAPCTTDALYLSLLMAPSQDFDRLWGYRHPGSFRPTFDPLIEHS
jgi:hypothetical protein